MATDVQVHSNEFHAEPPRQILAPPIEWIDTAPDGKILVRLPAEQGVAPPMTVVLNWDKELKEITFQRTRH